MPKITEEDLKKAEEKGYALGFQEGKEKAVIEQKKEFEAHLSKMQRKLENLPNLLQQEVAYIQKQSLSFIQHVLKKTIRHAAEKQSEEVLTFMLNEAFEKAPKAELCVRLSPADRFYLQEKGSNILDQTHIKFKEDDTISRGGCTVEWDNSGVDARLSNVINELDTFIKAAADNVTPHNIKLQYKEKGENEQASDSTSNTTEAEDTQEVTNTQASGEMSVDDNLDKPETQEQTEDLEEKSSEDVTSSKEKEKE